MVCALHTDSSNLAITKKEEEKTEIMIVKHFGFNLQAVDMSMSSECIIL